MSQLALSASFEYLGYESTPIKNILLLQRWDRLKTSESDFYRLQILMSIVDPRAVRVKLWSEGGNTFVSHKCFFSNAHFSFKFVERTNKKLQTAIYVKSTSKYH